MTSDGYRGFQSDRVRKIETRERWKVSDGDPSGSVSAAISTYCWDYTNDNLYVNNDGATAWTLIGGTGGVTGSGTTPELAYWTGANTIGSATDIEFIAGGGLDFQGGASAIIQFADDTGRALSFFDAGGLLYQNFNSTNAQPETTFNELGADIDFRIEGDTDTHLFFIDAGNDRLGINESAPATQFHITNGAGLGVAIPINPAVDTWIVEAASGNNIAVQIYTSNTNVGSYGFSDNNARNRGGMQYSHSSDQLNFYTNGLSKMWIQSNGDVGIGALSPATRLEVEENETLSGNLSDGYAAAITLDPLYDQNFTVTRHNYIDVNNVSLTNSAAVTDGCVFRFDAAAGTHTAVDSGTTKTTPGTVNAWLKVNINGTVHYIPCYTSKTS